MQVEDESGGPEAEERQGHLPDVNADGDEDDDDIGVDDVDPDSTTWYVSTTDAESERSLAKKLGYPPGWHVVRVVPHPADAVINGTEEATAEAGDEDGENREPPPPAGDEKSENPKRRRVRGKSCMDVIHAGPPENCPDTYYNHSAALRAASEFPTDGTGTGYEKNGGQMLPRVALFHKGDWVEVLYDEDDDDGGGGEAGKEDDDKKKWYRAQVEKVKHYTNDIRYTVNYVDEDATQVVSEELLRKASPPEPKKRKKKKEKVKKEPKAKAKAKAKSSSKHPAPKPTKKKDHASRKFTKKELRERQKMAKAMGLPEFWLASKNEKYKYDIISPGGERFKSKKAAYAFLGWDEAGNRKDGDDTDEEADDDDDDEDGDEPSTSESKKRKKKEEGEGRTKKRRKKESPGDDDAANVSDETDDAEAQAETQPVVEDEEEGDPPWRRTGHEYIGRRVRYAQRSDETGREHVQVGRVTGWLDATDVDSNGEAAFLSEKDGKPAMLFHVSFKGEGVHEPGELLFQDFEDFELVEWLIPEERT